jgi:hypothetical protein
MEQAIPGQDPAVVLRSHYTVVRALLAIATLAVVALTIAAVLLATENDGAGGTSSTRPIHSIQYGAFNPNTGSPESAPLPR